MTAIHETAYPRMRSHLSAQELEALYTPSPDDLTFLHRATPSPVAACGGGILLNTFQRLGSLPHFAVRPPRLIQPVATVLGVLLPHEALQHSEQRRRREWHIPQSRTHCGLTAFSDGGRRVLVAALLEAAQSKDIIADILHVGLEALVKAREELPAFSPRRRAAQKARAQVNHRSYRQGSMALEETQRLAVTRWLSRDDHDVTSPWHQLNREPKQPTLTPLREHLAHVRWWQSLNTARQAFQGIPETTLQRFADEARAMDASRMKATQQPKPLTLAVALMRIRTAQALDDLADMLIRRVQQLHHQGQEALQEYRDQHQEQTAALIALLGQMGSDWPTNETPEQRLTARTARSGAKAETMRAPCAAHMGYAGNNDLLCLPALLRSPRKTCLDVLTFLHPTSTSAETALARAMAFVLAHRETRAERLPVMARPQGAAEALDVSWVPVGWWKAVTGRPRRDVPIMTVHRRYRELWVLSCAVSELQSGDLYIAGSERFSDSREQLVTWEAEAQPIAPYGQQGGSAADPARCMADLQAQRTEAIRTTDAAFPMHTALTITNGEPRLRRLENLPEPEGFALIDPLGSERLPERHIVAILTDTEHWFHWTAAFGPLSGFETRLTSPRHRYVTTTFGDGGYLGPPQTARSIQALDRFQVADIHQRHITEQQLLDANVEVINRSKRFRLPKRWGAGQRAAADGTKWDIDEHNRLSAYHIRSGGWGGIGYSHVSDTSIALCSSFIACGVWEAVYMLDGLLENRSEMRPDTLHAETQGQSETVFGLAYLLAIQWMPRIRHWKPLTLDVPTTQFAVEDILPIRERLSEAIDGSLIKTHLPDMLRVALSISQGKVRSSTILRKLGTESRKNKRFVAFRALGRVVRTIFLLRFINDGERRRTIHAATNIAEAWNGLIQWVALGGDGVIRQNNRAEQRTIIRSNHLVANLVVFHNVVSMTRVLQALIDEGYPVTPEIIARLAPYKIGHINRFGHYDLRFDQPPPPITEELRLAPARAVS